MATAQLDNPAATVDAAGVTVAALPRGERLVSLDALRGFDMFWIVGGSAFLLSFAAFGDGPVNRFFATQLKHVPWEGFVFYDLIFPLFLFIVGASLVFSLDKALSVGGRGAVMLRVLRRSVLLFTLGVFHAGGLTKPWPDVQLGGVLHRIAACYLAAAIIYIFVRSIKGLLIVAGACLIGYWLLLFFVPFPDIQLDKAIVKRLAKQVGSDSPAAIAAAVPSRVHRVYDEGRNLTNYIDFRYLPGRKAQTYYINEGLLSTLPAIALPLLGAAAGLLLRNGRIIASRKIAYLATAGIVCISLGLAWSTQFPIIKRIWTSSFVLVAAGLSALLLAVFYYLVDVRGYRRWCAPFVWIGCNAITMYILHNLVSFPSIAARLCGGDVKRFLDRHVANGLGGVTIAAVALLLIVAVARFLYVRKIFIRL